MAYRLALLITIMMQQQQQQQTLALNITSAYIIALVPAAASRLANETRAWLDGVGDTHASVIVTKAIRDAETNVPIGTRISILQGRHSHESIGSTAALGCLLSHMAIWRRVGPNDTVAVFEEDATLDAVSVERMRSVEGDLMRVEWDLVMLESGHITTTGPWRYIGEGNIATCADASCQWHGSRGYLLRYRAAQELLKEIPHVQVDALFWMMAAVRRMRMYWATRHVVHQNRSALSSTVWDGCLKCYIQPSNAGLLLFMALIGVIASVYVVQMKTSTALQASRQYIARLKR
jgi:GR25 family glycosyltransferase involved in LPS biosynthesis